MIKLPSGSKGFISNIWHHGQGDGESKTGGVLYICHPEPETPLEFFLNPNISDSIT